MYNNISPGYLSSLIPQQVDAILETQTSSKLLDLKLVFLLQLLLAIDTATMEQSIYRNKTAKVSELFQMFFERGQTYCAQILLLWGKKKPSYFTHAYVWVAVHEIWTFLLRISQTCLCANVVVLKTHSISFFTATFISDNVPYI